MTGHAGDMAGWPDDLGLPTSESDRAMAALYAEFAEEDHTLAEAGLSTMRQGWRQKMTHGDRRPAYPSAQGILSAKADNRF